MEADTRKGLLLGIVVGVAGTWAYQSFAGTLQPLLRPALKQGMKAATLVTDRSREMAAEMAESLDDLWAEVRAEVEEERTGSFGDDLVPQEPETP